MNYSRPRGFCLDWKPAKGSATILAQVAQILKEYSEFLPLTVRQIFYRMVASYCFEKSETGYARLQELLVKARRAQRIPMESIRDDGFYESPLHTIIDADHAIYNYRNYASNEQLNRQRGQDRPLVVWCEARGMAGMLEKVTLPYGIPVMTSGGYDSLTTQHDMGRRLAANEGLVLHMGDYDPSGVAMYKALEQNIMDFAKSYGGVPAMERVSVLEPHIDEYSLSTAPPKKADKRSVFTDNRTVQLEAFAPNDLLALLKREIESRMNMQIYQDVIAEEQIVRRELLGRLTTSND